LNVGEILNVCANTRPPDEPLVEAVEKVNLYRIWSVGRKSDLSECSVFDNLMLARGQETPENHPLSAVKGFFCRLVIWWSLML
jgi:hypothetical protein